MQNKSIVVTIILIVSLMLMLFIAPINTLKAETCCGRRLSTDPHKCFRIRPGTQKAVYLTGGSIGNIEKRKEIYKLIRETELNSVVFDVKDDWGYIDYNTGVEFASEIAADKNYYDIETLLDELNQRRIYSIARMVVFKDSILPISRPELAIKDSRTGEPLYSEGSYWPDIYSEEILDYHIKIIKELAEKGVKEIQFDYIRAPARGNICYAEYTHNIAGHSKVWAITNFLKKVREETKYYDIRISADVFGWVFIVNNDQGIGQLLEEMAPYLDYIYPMTYPSHYSTNFLGYRFPEKHPYEVVKYTLEDGLSRIGNTGCMIVPWVQAFSLNERYTEKEILEQIRAAEELGIEGFLFWNAANKYKTVERALIIRDDERQ